MWLIVVLTPSYIIIKTLNVINILVLNGFMYTCYFIFLFCVYFVFFSMSDYTHKNTQKNNFVLYYHVHSYHKLFNRTIDTFSRSTHWAIRTNMLMIIYSNHFPNIYTNGITIYTLLVNYKASSHCKYSFTDKLAHISDALVAI